MKILKNDKNGKLLIKLLIILVIVVLIVGSIYYLLRFKFLGIKHEALNEANLGITTDIYNSITTDMTEAEFQSIRNVVLFGTDSRDPDNFYAGRSDTIIIASINTKSKSIKLISIPRDTYVNIEGYGMDKINHAYAFGKEELSIHTINSNFGLNIDEYVTIDFSGLTNIIDEVGGVTVDIDDDEMEFINTECNPKLTHSGTVTLNGAQALKHSRNRYVGNDFYRAERQRNILIALMEKISEMDTTTILSLTSDFLKQVKTNVDISEYISLGTTIIGDKNEYLQNIISIQVPSTDYSEGKYIDGIYYFTTDLERAKKDFYTYLYEK
ncbi:MAG: LCP family protein [Clostridia bacterium]|nr:LCP family protein [Clostridia bacterium]